MRIEPDVEVRVTRSEGLIELKHGGGTLLGKVVRSSKDTLKVTNARVKLHKLAGPVRVFDHPVYVPMNAVLYWCPNTEDRS